MKELEFFININPPTTTHQAKRLAVSKSGKPYMFDSEKLKTVKKDLKAKLYKHKPKAPLEGACIIDIIIIFKAKGQHREGDPYLLKPDWDNSAKVPQDSLVELGFFKDDCIIFDGRVRKFWGDTAGYLIKIKEI